MEQIFLWITVGCGYIIANSIVNKLTGTNQTGWQNLICDTPAFLAGILSCYLLIH